MKFVSRESRETNLLFPKGPGIKEVCTQKDGDVHDKFNFLEIQELRPLKTCQKHFETIFPNFLPDECGI